MSLVNMVRWCPRFWLEPAMFSAVVILHRLGHLYIIFHINYSSKQLTQRHESRISFHYVQVTPQCQLVPTMHTVLLKLTEMICFTLLATHCHHFIWVRNTSHLLITQCNRLLCDNICVEYGPSWDFHTGYLGDVWNITQLNWKKIILLIKMWSYLFLQYYYRSTQLTIFFYTSSNELDIMFWKIALVLFFVRCKYYRKLLLHIFWSH